MRGALAGGDAPFTRLATDDKGRRLRKMCREMAGPKDEEYLESIGEVDVDELQHAWLDVSVIIFVFYCILYVSLTSFPNFADVYSDDYGGTPSYNFDCGE